MISLSNDEKKEKKKEKTEKGNVKKSPS
jgi:hypothetical protein